MEQVTKTKVAYKETDTATGQSKVYITSETAWNRIVEKAKTYQEAPPELIATQTFAYKKAQTVDEAVELAGGEAQLEVFLGVFNYGAGLRQDNAANDLLTSDSFQPTEGAVDVSFAVAEKQERAKMSNEEKAAKTLGISPELLKQALASILAAQSSGHAHAHHNG